VTAVHRVRALRLLSVLPAYTGYAVAVAALVALLLASPAVEAQTPTVTTIPLPFSYCVSADSMRATITTIQTLVLVLAIVIVAAVVALEFLGTFAQIAARLGDFFLGRIGILVEIFIIYFLFLYPFNSNWINTSSGGCGTIDWQALLTRGPLFFRLVGWIIYGLGLGAPPSA